MKEIRTAVIAAVIGGIAMYILTSAAGLLEKTLNDDAIKKVVNRLLDESDKRKKLLEFIKNDKDFKGPRGERGEKGIQGEQGIPGGTQITYSARFAADKNNKTNCENNVDKICRKVSENVRFFGNSAKRESLGKYRLPFDNSQSPAGVSCVCNGMINGSGGASCSVQHGKRLLYIYLRRDVNKTDGIFDIHCVKAVTDLP